MAFRITAKKQIYSIAWKDSSGRRCNIEAGMSFNIPSPNCNSYEIKKAIENSVGAKLTTFVDGTSDWIIDKL